MKSQATEKLSEPHNSTKQHDNIKFVCLGLGAFASLGSNSHFLAPCVCLWVSACLIAQLLQWEIPERISISSS